MKSVLIFLVLLFLTTQIQSQHQENFIIGADWLNPRYPNPDATCSSLGQNYWDLIHSFGLNYGNLYMSRRSNICSETEVAIELNKAAEKGLSIWLFTYEFYGIHGRRWMYQIEDDEDFNYHIVGTSAYEEPEPLTGFPEPHWSTIKINEEAHNYFMLESWEDEGYAADGLINNNEIPDQNAFYYVKLGIRKTQEINDTTRILDIKISKADGTGTEWVRTIKANDIPNAGVWNEYTRSDFRFKKTAQGPTYNFEEDIDNYILFDTLGTLGIDDYIIDGVSVNTPYEIKIYWHGLVSCDLDYIAIDDLRSHYLHMNDTNYNNKIQKIATEFLTNEGLGNIKVWDEPARENLLWIRNAKNKIDAYIAGTGYEHKVALAYHSPFIGIPRRSSAQQYLAQSQLDILLSNIFPIPYYYPHTTNLFVKPGQSQYNEILQARFNSNLIGSTSTPGLYEEGLYLESSKALVFNVPFWFTPQADFSGNENYFSVAFTPSLLLTTTDNNKNFNQTS